MQNFDGITEAADAVNQWFWGNKSALPEDLVNIIQPLLGPTKSAVDLVAKTAEEIYKRRASMDPAAQQLGAGLAAFCHLWGFHGMDQDARGEKMAFAIRRDSGEKAPAGIKWPAPENDPEVKG